MRLTTEVNAAVKAEEEKKVKCGERTMKDDVRRVHLCERVSENSIRFKIIVVRFD